MIQVEQLSAGYGGAPVLHNVSFSVAAGENLSIIGPNGCGKTTLLRAMAATMPHTGVVRIDGQDTRSMKRKALAKRIAMLSQNTQLYFNYTVYDTVMMGRYVHRSDSILQRTSQMDRSAVEAALRQLDLWDLRERDADTLSGGQLQRVFLAKILAQDPDIILLDEPTNHLDLSFQVDLIRFLRDWSLREQKSAIGVLHDVNLAMLLADRVLLLDEGHVRAYGACTEVFAGEALQTAYRMDVGAYMRETLHKWEGFRPPTPDDSANGSV